MTVDPLVTSRVVLAFDGSSPARTALVLGTSIAAERGADLLLVCVVDEPEGPSWAASLTATAKQSLAVAAEQARAVLGQGRVQTAVRLGHAALSVLGETRPGDLVVTGTHGHRPVAGILLGSTSSALVTHAKCPVLIARSSSFPPAAPVVVAVDGSEVSQGAVRMAADEADRRRVVLRAVMAVPPVVDAAGIVAGPDDAVLQAARTLLGEAVAGLHTDRPDLVVETDVKQGHPVEVLVNASRQAGLLVLGSRGRGPIRSTLLGSVGREVAQRARCSVLVVRPAQRHSDTPDQAHESHTASALL